MLPPTSPSAGTPQDEALPPFELLYERYRVRVYRYMYAHLKHEQDADLMQQVFVQAWEHRQTYEPGRGTVAIWLLSIAHHRLIDFYRLSRPMLSWEAIPDVHAADQDPEATVLSQESMALVRQLLEALPRVEQELLALRFAARLSSAEIAALMGKSEAATRKQLGRLLRRLQERYRQRLLLTPLPGWQELAPPAFQAALPLVYATPSAGGQEQEVWQRLQELIRPGSS